MASVFIAKAKDYSLSLGKNEIYQDMQTMRAPGPSLRGRRACFSTFMPSAAPTARSQHAKPKERLSAKPAPASASIVASVPASGLLRCDNPQYLPKQTS